MPAKKPADVYEALAKVHDTLEPLGKDAVNPFHKNKYRTLGSILKHIRPVLKENNLLLYFVHEEDCTQLVLRYTDGSAITSSLKHVLEKQHGQAVGSACTYSQRYLLEGLFLIPGEDDDGNGCSGNTGATKPNQGSPGPLDNPFLSMSSPRALVDKVKSAVAKNPIDQRPEDWVKNISKVDQAIVALGWSEDPIIVDEYKPIKSSVDMIAQAKDLFDGKASPG